MMTPSIARIIGCSLAFCTVSFSQAEDAKLTGAEPRQVVAAESHANLQAAIDALDGKPGVVRIPPGVYEISEPLTISAEDVTIEGCGTGTHIKNINTDGKPALIVETPKGKKSLWRVMLSNFRITGNEKSGHGIVARKINEFFVQGVTVSYHGGHGIF